MSTLLEVLVVHCTAVSCDEQLSKVIELWTRIFEKGLSKISLNIYLTSENSKKLKFFA